MYSDVAGAEGLAYECVGEGGSVMPWGLSLELARNLIFVEFLFTMLVVVVL